MTTEDDVMAILARTNPAPADNIAPAPTDGRRYLHQIRQRSEPVTIIDASPAVDSPFKRPLWIGLAAGVMALALLAAVVVVANNDGDGVPTTQPVPAATTTSTTPIDVSGATAVFDELVTAHNASDTELLMALFAADVAFTRRFRSETPNPAFQTEGRPELENAFVWDHAQADVWLEPRCEVADEQLPGGTTISCSWSTFDSLSQAVEGPVIPTTALIVVADGRINGFHTAQSQSAWSTAVLSPFQSWMDRYQPDVEGVECCESDSLAESERRGALRAEWAKVWAAWLAEFGCETSSCSWTLEEWVAAYGDLCVELDGPQGLPEQFADDVWLFPRPVLTAQLDTVIELAQLDRDLATGSVSDAELLELQRERLGAMVELGIDERCHPDLR